MLDLVDLTNVAEVKPPSASALRVLSVVPGLPVGWIMIFARNQIADLETLGVINRSFYLRSRTSPWVLLQEALRFRREVIRFQPDLVHAHFGTVSAFFCAVLTRRSLVISFRGQDLQPYPGMNVLRSLVARWLSQLAAFRAARIICVSSPLKAKLWWRHSRIVIIPDGVDIELFKPMPRRGARAALGWDEDEKIVISSAGTDPLRKRLDRAQAAVEVAESLCGKIRFVVLDGRSDQREVAMMMNAADCLLFTSDAEGSPNIVKEAIACNLPVLSVDIGDVRERLRDVVPSRIVSRDPHEIGQALAEILAKPQRSNGAQLIQDLSAENIALRVLRLYEEALKR